MNDSSSFRVLLEKLKAAEEVRQISLPVAKNNLEPVFTVETIDLHYGTLYRNYVKKSLAGDGEFQTAGAVLHTLFFEQFQEPKARNMPVGASESLIEKKYGSYAKFQEKLVEQALSIQGSGWVYMTRTGSIKTIPNHKIVDDVALIIDMWEHSYILDYGSDKKKYLSEFWKIINWSKVNERLE
jgi:Fe-Mn family superoxide dismutase